MVNRHRPPPGARVRRCPAPVTVTADSPAVLCASLSGLARGRAIVAAGGLCRERGRAAGRAPVWLGAQYRTDMSLSSLH